MDSPFRPVTPSISASMRRIAAVATVLLVALLAGCASLPAPAPRAATQALADTGATALQQAAAASLAGAPAAHSGWRLLPDGPEAFDTRLSLARRAAASLDVQVYVIERDTSGAQFLNALAEAAARGVRVRLLVDDLYAAELDADFARLASHGVAVRVFNPLPVRGAAWHTRLLLSLHDFGRINRRMHNKLFIADGAFAVTGGRNVGDAYFMRSEAANFADMDVLAAGPAVRELSTVFDAYWNSDAAWPVERLAGGTRPAIAAPPSAVTAEPAEPAEAADPDNGVAAELAQGRVGLHFATARIHADAPAKIRIVDPEAAPGAAMQGALALFESAHDEVRLVSPYFVPGRKGMGLMRAASERGVHIRVLTNSLAATDEPLTYFGYLRYREPMLRLGVALDEVAPAPAGAAPRHGERRSSAGRLHAKVALVDRRFVMIGSVNMDNRSSRTNTEMALVIDSAALAAEAAAIVDGDWSGARWRLQIAAGDGRTQWTPAHDAAAPALSLEPGVGPLMRLRGGLLSVLVPEDML